MAGIHTRPHPGRALSALCLGLLLPLQAGCSPEPIPVSDHVRVLPVSGMEGVALGMKPEELLSLRPGLALARYAGYSDSAPAHRTTFGFSDPCYSDWLPEDECPVRGRLEYIEVEFGREAAGGQTLFVEHWGEFFDGPADPVYCIEYRPFPDAGGVEAHWDDDSGLWATLREVSWPTGAPDSARTSYRIGMGEHAPLGAASVETSPGPWPGTCEPGVS